MKARHVWVMFALAFGLFAFADEVSAHGIMLGWYGWLMGLKAFGLACGGILLILALILSLDNE